MCVVCLQCGSAGGVIVCVYVCSVEVPVVLSCVWYVSSVEMPVVLSCVWYFCSVEVPEGRYDHLMFNAQFESGNLRKAIQVRTCKVYERYYNIITVCSTASSS